MTGSYSEYAAIFKALSDETRLHIFSMLSDKEICGCHILRKVEITQPTLSYHMKLLCDCGLVKGRKDGSWMRYTLNVDKVSQVQSFLEAIKEPYKHKSGC